MIAQRFWEVVDREKGGPNARNAVIRLLKALPTRCNARQVDVLDELLWMGLESGWKSDLSDFAGQRLTRKHMDGGQRVRWLGLALLCDPGKHRTALAEAIEGRERLVRHLARFFVHGAGRRSQSSVLQIAASELMEPDLSLIIRLIGRFFAPFEPRGFMIPSDELPAVAELLGSIIRALGSNPSKSASESLDSLLQDSRLANWHDALSAARKAQCTLRGDAELCHPTIQQACETLRDGRPANACDLAALTGDKLKEIGLRIRTSNSNEWRQYWNGGPRGVPRAPKVEDAFRDALVAALRQILPRWASVEPEGQFVNRTRADITVSADGFRIPVEVKRNGGRDLWKAINDQLVPKYTMDPATGGYGIYLVFWFGAEHQQKRADGVVPEEPSELERLLQKYLSRDLVRRIEVQVVDVCPPGPSGRAHAETTLHVAEDDRE